MNHQSIPPLRVKSQELSLWQSVVAAYAIKETEKLKNIKGKLNLTHVQEHPMVSGTNHLAATCEKKNSIESHLFIEEPHEASTDDEIIAHFSSEFFQAAKSSNGISEEALETLNKDWQTYDRKFSNKDYSGWAYCYEQYRKYGALHNYKNKYNDWKDNGSLDFGVIYYKLPNDAKVAIIGDWGTGMDDAKHLLKVIFENHKPDAIIHLGDIYYAATPAECEANFAAIFEEFFKRYPRIPIFTIPGNHDYYCYGYGYYKMVANLNRHFSIDATQFASYFCLRTEDNGWQFLGMDTGYNDNDPKNAFNPVNDGPELHSNEPSWHIDKLNKFSGATIMLSHHQLFSGNAKINGSDGTYGSFPYLNKNLLDLFRPYFGNKITSWLWGHEHNQVKYDNNLFGLPIGRLIGASAYEEAKSDNPYKQTFPEVPISSNLRAQLGMHDNYYNHGFAIADFSQRVTPKDPVVMEYFQYPSWGDTTPSPIPTKALPMWRELFKLQSTTKEPVISYGQVIHLNLELGNAFIGQEVEHFDEYRPTIQTTAVRLKISDATNSSNPIKDGETIFLTTEETTVGNYSHLGAWDTGVYYSTYKSDDKHLQWMIKKVISTPSDLNIRENEAVYLFNQEFPKMYLSPNLPIVNSVRSTYTYLTTDKNVNANWFIQLPKSSKVETLKKIVSSLNLDFDIELFENITKHLGGSLKNKDAALVACSDEKELKLVKTNFLIKKLGLSDSPKLDETMQKVCELMGKSNRQKHRESFYYLLTALLEKEAIFKASNE
ncbi:hypothetical protein IMCC3317_09570 [Kordia antarctica]|uniref:Calcineurin-like phosphoesterase domain-containing protein n=1 Tax=Kordia antarctica TaxID=1218801 RepID=A0A7L4ZGP9_9FLAO|nr:DUF2853 family protein [Kordia antarctica]QHI35611.1 hypothetical protein IMCC3317_09570 [Kordia antarctica]